MTNSSDITFTVWGARGSIFSGGPERLEFGGDTTCFTLETERGLLAVDAGSGFRALGQSLMARGGDRPGVIDLLLTHLHLDHICGLPFFEPLLGGSTELRIWNANPGDSDLFSDTLQCLMSPPVFPSLTYFDGLNLSAPKAGMAVELAMGGTARPFALNHPDGASGWRIECGGRVISVASDHEAGQPQIDNGIIEATRDSDLLICDATYTDDEIAARAGWGHSTWRQGLEIGKQAGAKHILMTHHDPERSDADIIAMEKEARQHAPNITFARSGWQCIL